MTNHWAYEGSLYHFLNEKNKDLLEQLISQHINRNGERPSGSQIEAWKKSLPVLKDQLNHWINNSKIDIEPHIVFEYELPRERGRRPDVVLLVQNLIIVIEFKQGAQVVRANVDQTRAYVRDLANYHSGSHKYDVRGVLVNINSQQDLAEKDDILIASGTTLSQALASFNITKSTKGIDPKVWLESDYEPLPYLVEAARRIFLNEPLPKIRQAESAGIPQALESLVQIAQEAQGKREHHLALLTGVPGSGKTLVGLSFVYENHFGDEGGSRTAVFLSGNGPLVQVLQHALKSSIFVRDVHGFLKTYGGDASKIPAENIWIYDEAQRAWDSERVQQKRNHGASEPMDFIHIGSRKSWSLMIGLIGVGQEIHLGEESGLTQWNEAIADSGKFWKVHAHPKISDMFFFAEEVIQHSSLDLTMSLRSHLSEDLHTFVDQMLKGNTENTINLLVKVIKQGFDIYVSNDFEKLKKYTAERYYESADKRYGIIASSKAKNLEQFGIMNGYLDTRRVRFGPWYNDPPFSPNSGCKLETVVTEFGCQGLELDFPLLAWGDDLKWNGDNWISKPQLRSKARDPHQLRINSYRVLLTRGRDGIGIFVPPTEEMLPTYGHLQALGIPVV